MHLYVQKWLWKLFSLAQDSTLANDSDIRPLVFILTLISSFHKLVQRVTEAFTITLLLCKLSKNA